VSLFHVINPKEKGMWNEVEKGVGWSGKRNVGWSGTSETILDFHSR